MKKIIQIPSLFMSFTALFLTLILSQLPAKAQSPISLQADAGLSIASLKRSENRNKMDYLSLNGLQGRLVAGYQLSDNFSLHAGLGYVQMGASVEHEDHHDDIRINALEIPVLFRYQLPLGSGSLGLSAGPALAYHLSAHRHEHEDGNEAEEELTIGNAGNDYMKPTNLSLQAEVSYTHSSGILLNLRYNAGLMDLVTSDLIEMRSSYLAVGLGYRIF